MGSIPTVGAFFRSSPKTSSSGLVTSIGMRNRWLLAKVTLKAALIMCRDKCVSYRNNQRLHVDYFDFNTIS
ncbi:hypothetical protein DPMN_085233 [Dreissena polymorpha]|uniref:Uncharacterized protein n=1 Tax=Dreissena polymorpha TaxID=45954 RepID=A0A9D3YC09_DREPO|nr:hypothetical protein DPMN_085233 [Dreissena polymorpha]